ncbi:MAG: TetR/AcrR family transcriptional regulator [Sphingomonadaceae bacterium]|nr:TetR/AcrR family transcriptional regulator [Sphingomonadaceae bacterium]
MIDHLSAVKIESSTRSYHHGGLRQAVIDEGLRLLDANQKEPDALSLRQIARNVGVSAPAVYHHFPDKQALLKSLADYGMQMLAEQQAEAAKIGGETGFAEMGRTYVRFAIANPGLFRLIFSHMPMRISPSTSALKGSPEWMLRDYIKRTLGPTATAREQFAAVVRVWSLIHGLSMLILDEQVDHQSAEELLDEILEVGGLRLKVRTQT